MSNSISRRSLVKTLTGATAVLGMGATLPSAVMGSKAASNGRVNHSVCKWCYPDISLDNLALEARRIGLSSIELLGPDDWPTLKKHGLICAMATGPAGIKDGFNRLENHAVLVPAYRKRISEVAEAGFPNVITFSGNRAGLDNEEGLHNCVVGIKQIMSAAERENVTVCMELLNSKVNHPDYMCDHTAWGVELVKQVGSDRFKLLYDIYHMQIMEGDIIRTIQDNHQYIGHYHTGGNPGRHEIDETQELYYPAIMRAILDTGFSGFVAQEFVPSRDPLTSLAQAVSICDV